MVWGGAPAAYDFGASLGKKGFDSTKTYISLCGGVARKFSLVKIPILRHCFPIFSYGEKN